MFSTYEKLIYKIKLHNKLFGFDELQQQKN